MDQMDYGAVLPPSLMVFLQFMLRISCYQKGVEANLEWIQSGFKLILLTISVL